jgi:hypothetical protein
VASDGELQCLFELADGHRELLEPVLGQVELLKRAQVADGRGEHLARVLVQVERLKRSEQEHGRGQLNDLIRVQRRHRDFSQRRHRADEQRNAREPIPIKREGADVVKLAQRREGVRWAVDVILIHPQVDDRIQGALSAAYVGNLLKGGGALHAKLGARSSHSPSPLFDSRFVQMSGGGSPEQKGSILHHPHGRIVGFLTLLESRNPAVRGVNPGAHNISGTLSLAFTGLLFTATESLLKLHRSRCVYFSPRAYSHPSPSPPLSLSLCLSLCRSRADARKYALARRQVYAGAHYCGNAIQLHNFGSAAAAAFLAFFAVCGCGTAILACAASAVALSLPICLA